MAEPDHSPEPDATAPRAPARRPGARGRRPLLRFLATRLASMVALLLLLGLAVFALMKLAPGDMVENYVRAQMLISSDRQADNVYTEEQIAAAKGPPGPGPAVLRPVRPLALPGGGGGATWGGR